MYALTKTTCGAKPTMRIGPSIAVPRSPGFTWYAMSHVGSRHRNSTGDLSRAGPERAGLGGGGDAGRIRAGRRSVFRTENPAGPGGLLLPLPLRSSGESQ